MMQHDVVKIVKEQKKKEKEKRSRLIDVFWPTSLGPSSANLTVSDDGVPSSI